MSIHLEGVGDEAGTVNYVCNWGTGVKGIWEFVELFWQLFCTLKTI